MVAINTRTTGVDRGWGRFVKKANGQWTIVVPDDDAHMIHNPAIDSGAHFYGFARREVWPLFAAFCARLEDYRGSKIREYVPGQPRTPSNWQCWSGQIRPIRGLEASALAGNIDSWSNHSYGTAFDIESGENPLGSPGWGTLHGPKTASFAHAYGFRCGASTAVGGDYTGRADRMHVEFMGTPADAIALREAFGIGDDMSVAEDLRTVLGFTPGKNMQRPAGQADGNEDMYATLLGLAQSEVNRDNALRALVTAQSAAIAELAKAVAAGGGQSATDIEAAVGRAIKNNTLDITIHGETTLPS